MIKELVIDSGNQAVGHAGTLLRICSRYVKQFQMSRK